jgi:hypothetical protein
MRRVLLQIRCFFIDPPYTLIGKNDALMTYMTHLSISITFVVQLQLPLN